uniref:NBS-LRR protein n=1 Tax=Cicer arietinum TaxID=3827 RepID=V5THC6_CICAR|nr:NBS-LRR protein [Cicer arietinum]
MGGTGKTTLAKELGKELKKSEQFAHVIDTTVSFTPDIKKIQDDIAGPLGLKLENCNDSDRPKKLWSRLTNGEKILIIMDDVWDRDPPLDFDVIGIPKRDNHKGCKVLITTRSKRILNKMSCDKKVELEILSDEDAWIMFKRYVGINNISSKNLISKGHKITKECKGLPVAIAVIASSLNGQQLRKHEWDATLKSLKKPVTMHGVDEDMAGIYKCLKFSYDYMKDEKAKRLFLLSSIFPEDKEISVEILTRLGIGTGLFGEDYGCYDDTRNQVVVAKNKLIDSCLLLDVGERHVKMHDLVRDAAQWIANKEIRGVNLSIKDQKLLVQKEINIKYLLCEGKDMDLFSCKFECSKLETLVADIDRDESQKCMEVPNSFFKNIVNLRVLYFTGNEEQPLSLPQSIQSLTNIRSLLVDKVDLGDISILGKLQSLETLDLVSCAINELPFEITKLGKFKLLNLDNCEIRRNNPFEVIEKCSSLEELYFIKSFNGFCREITIPELQRYRICNYWYIMNYSQSKYVNFCASDDASVFSEATFKYFMRTTEFLRLIGIKRGWRNLMPEIVPIGQGMDDLVELRLSCISQLQCLIDSIGSQVPSLLSKLVVLELDNMENLEELFNGSLSFDSLKNLEMLSMKQCKKFKRLFNCKLNLCNLKTLILEKCPMLVSLFPLMSRNLVQLEKLEIADCEELKNIIDIKREEESIEEIDDGDNNNKKHGSIFPKLKVLDIEGCHRLESILPFLSSQDFPVLEAILVRKCDALKYIFSQYQHVELKSLKKMLLCQLPNFIHIFPKCYASMSSSVNESYSTPRDGFKEQIELDPIKCNIFSWTYICCHGDKFGSSSTTRIPLVSRDQPQDYSIASVTLSPFSVIF